MHCLIPALFLCLHLPQETPRSNLQELAWFLCRYISTDWQNLQETTCANRSAKQKTGNCCLTLKFNCNSTVQKKQRREHVNTGGRFIQQDHVRLSKQSQRLDTRYCAVLHVNWNFIIGKLSFLPWKVSSCYPQKDAHTTAFHGPLQGQRLVDSKVSQALSITCGNLQKLKFPHTTVMRQVASKHIRAIIVSAAFTTSPLGIPPQCTLPFKVPACHPRLMEQKSDSQHTRLL